MRKIIRNSQKSVFYVLLEMHILYIHTVHNYSYFVMLSGSIPNISWNIRILSALVFHPGPYYYTNTHHTPDTTHYQNIGIEYIIRSLLV